MKAICEKCNEETLDEETPVTCKICNAHFHPTCVESINGKVDDCVRCNSMIMPEQKTDEKSKHAEVVVVEDDKSQQAKFDNVDNKSQKSNAKSSVRSKRSSKSSKKLTKELELLEEKQRISMELIDQREKLLNEKIALSKTYIEEKSKLLNQIEELSEIDGQSATSSERGRRNVNEWLQSTSNQKQLKAGVTFGTAGASSSEQKLPPTLIQKNVPNALVQTNTPRSKTFLVNSVQISKEALDNRKSDMKNLSSFDGSPKNWPTFYSQFQLSTEKCQFQDIDNIIRLNNCLTGRARKAVQGALSQPENVSYIMSTLEQLFGKPEFIINELMKEVRDFTQLKVDKFGEIVEFALLVRNMTTTMKAASMSNHLWNPNLLQELIMKLPIQLQREWAQFQLTMPSFNLETFSQWMQVKARECACLLTEPPSFGENRIKKGTVHLHTEGNYTNQCATCEGDCKEVSLCNAFKRMSYKERFAVVNSNNLCKKCLKRHRNPCLRKEVCGIDSCAYKHHPLLHKYTEVHEVNVHHNQNNCSVFKVIPITLHHNNKSFPTFALLDDGSSITLIESEFAKLMNIKGTPQPICLKWTSDTHRYEQDSEKISVRVSGANGKTFLLHDLHTVTSLNLPMQTVDSKKLKEKHEYLRDVPFDSYENVRPTVLIGLNNVHLTIAHNTKMGSSNEPVAIKTQLGWVVFGSTRKEDDVQEVYHICECGCKGDQFEDIVRDYIALDNLNVVRPPHDLLSKEDERSLAILNDTTKFLDGSYETGLIWRYDNFQVPSSYGMALSRLKCLEKQISKNPLLRDQMQTQIDEYVENNYARELSTEETKIKRHWYLPLFVVRNPNKPCKIRLVWDAAATVNGVSLNSFLLKGPDQLVNLIGVLFRFRQFKIAVVGDIRHIIK